MVDLKNPNFLTQVIGPELQDFSGSATTRRPKLRLPFVYTDDPHNDLTIADFDNDIIRQYSGADPNAQYLTFITTGSLPNCRSLVVDGDTGLSMADGGAGQSVTLSIDTDVIAKLSRVPDQDLSYFVLDSSASLGKNMRVFACGNGLVADDDGPQDIYAVNIDNDIVATISGSTFTKLSGSLQRTAGGLSYLVAGANVTIVSQSNGQIVVSSTGGGSGGGADPGASYVVVGVTASLPNERALNTSATKPGVTITDNGAGSTVEFGINNNVVATISGSNFSGPVTGSAGFDCNNRRLANFCNRQSAVATTTGGFVVDTIDTYTPTIASGAIGVIGCRYFTEDALHNPSSAGVCDSKIYVVVPALGDLMQIGTPVYDNALRSGSVPTLSCSAGSVVAKLSTFAANDLAQCQWFFNNAVNLF